MKISISGAYNIRKKQHSNYWLPSNTLCSTDNQSTYFQRL